MSKQDEWIPANNDRSSFGGTPESVDGIVTGVNEQDDTAPTPEQIAEPMIRGHEAARRAVAAQVDELARLQAAVHQLREDYRPFRYQVLDARLNKIEADLGDCISRARGETK